MAKQKWANDNLQNITRKTKERPSLKSRGKQFLLHPSCYFLIVVCPFVLFLLAIVLSVLFRFMDSDYPFGIFRLFLQR